jgi:hypothetical protein
MALTYQHITDYLNTEGIGFRGATGSNGWYVYFLAFLNYYRLAGFASATWLRYSEPCYGNLSSWSFVIGTNNVDGNSTFKLYKVGTPTLLGTIVVPNLTTGTFSVGLSASLVSGDKIFTWLQLTGTTSQYIYVARMSLTYSGLFQPIGTIGAAYSGNISMYEHVYYGTEAPLNVFRPWYGQFNGITVQKVDSWVSSNTRDGTSTIIFRVNTVDSPLGVSIPASTTGFFSDIMNTATLDDGDNISLFLTIGGSSGWLAIGKCQAESTISDEYKRSHGKGTNIQVGYYSDMYAILQRALFDTTLAKGQRLANQTFTASRLSVYITQNTLNGVGSMRWMADGVLGNQTFSIPIGLTGFLSDITHTDEVTSAQYITVKWTKAGWSGEVAISDIQYLATFPQPSGHPYIARVQGIPGMRTFSQLGHGGI